MKVSIALVDDHVLLRNGLAGLLRDLNFNVVLEAGNGQQFIDKLRTSPLPQLVLMDINMPVMDGYETTAWLKKTRPSVKVVALSMLDDEISIIRMLKSGAKGYLLKESEPDELIAAIHSVLQKGFYHSEMMSEKMIHAISRSKGQEAEVADTTDAIKLNDKEIEFLKWACTELSYKEIAAQMGISPRTVDNYRDSLQEKLDCKGRIGLVLWAIKNGVVTV